MNRTTPFRPTALLLVLSLLLMGAGFRAPSCGDACCAGDRMPSHASATQRVTPSSACCCGTAAVPCDIEKAPGPDLPETVLSAPPRIDAPVLLAAVPSTAALGQRPDRATRPSLAHPFAQGPPGPVYLLTQTFLC